MAVDEYTLTEEQLATISANILHQTLIEVSRTVGKRLFRELESGTRIAVTQLPMEDGSEVRVDLKLDCSEFRGALNFSLFRDSVLALLSRLSDILRDAESALPVMHLMDEAGHTTSERRLFAVPGVIVLDDVPNMLMMGATPSPSEPVILIELMYIDPDQFAQSPETKDSSTS